MSSAAAVPGPAVKTESDNEQNGASSATSGETKESGKATSAPSRSTSDRSISVKDEPETVVEGPSSAAPPVLAYDIDPRCSWTEFESALYDSGWGYKKGDGLISFYYLAPAFKGKRVKEVRANGRRGVDYFESTEDLREYCREAYGWIGPEEAPSNGSSSASHTVVTRSFTATPARPRRSPAGPSSASNSPGDIGSPGAVDDFRSSRSENENGSTDAPVSDTSSATQADQKPNAGTPSCSFGHIAGSSRSHDEKTAPQLRQTVPVHCSWKEMEIALFNSGWVYKPGSGLVQHIYIVPALREMERAEVLRNGRKGIEYFEAVDDLQAYCRENYGWVGPEGLWTRRVVDKGADEARPTTADPAVVNSSSLSAPKLNRAVQPDWSWKEMESVLLESGWGWKKGTGLISYIYVTPAFKHRYVSDALKYGEKFVDYFEHVDHLKVYCREKYGWIGPEMNESTPYGPLKATLFTDGSGLMQSSSGDRNFMFDWITKKWARMADKADQARGQSARAKKVPLPPSELARAKAFFARDLQAGYVKNMLTQCSGLLFLEVDTSLVTCIAVLLSDSCIEVTMIATQSEHRKLGFGRIAMALMVQAAESMKSAFYAPRFFVRGETRAKHFYTACGLQSNAPNRDPDGTSKTIYISEFHRILNEKSDGAELLSTALESMKCKKSKAVASANQNPRTSNGSKKSGVAASSASGSTGTSRESQSGTEVTRALEASDGTNEPQTEKACAAGPSSGSSACKRPTPKKDDSSQPTQKKPRSSYVTWNVGDDVSAPWEDGEYYRGSILRLPSKEFSFFRIVWENEKGYSDIPPTAILKRAESALDEGSKQEERDREEGADEKSAKQIAALIRKKGPTFRGLADSLELADYHSSLLLREMEKGEEEFLQFLQDAGLEDLLCRKSAMAELKQYLLPACQSVHTCNE